MLVGSLVAELLSLVILGDIHHTQTQYKQQLETGLGDARYQIPQHKAMLSNTILEREIESLSLSSFRYSWDVLLVHSKEKRRLVKFIKRREEGDLN